MTIEQLHAKQSTRRQSKDLERIMRDEPTTIHPIARARGITQDDIEVGMPCTVKLARWVEGPATVTTVERSVGGRAWRVRVRPEFDATAAVYERVYQQSNAFRLRSWAFLMSDKQAFREVVENGRTSKVGPHPFYAYRHGSPNHDAVMWQHRRLLVGHAEARDPELTAMIAETRQGYVPRTFSRIAEEDRNHSEIDAFYASTVYGISRFLTSQGIGAATPDTLDSLLGPTARTQEVPRGL